MFSDLNQIKVQHKIPMTHLSRREYGHVVLVDDPGLLLYELRAPLLLELLARQPEEDVLLAVLATEEGAENPATGYNWEKENT